ncbi:hypothetical protein RA27_10300 [Ruegeria sp. ANG-R]|nr:hypothetical protein RA27_10300 [Ruegeria sp. ANG-R]
MAGLLDQSPQICVSDPKEPHFFSRHFDKGLDYYRSCFPNPDAQVLVDASTTYSFLRPLDQIALPEAPGVVEPVPERIAELRPDARIIYILRHPIERAMSALKHKLRSVPATDTPVQLIDALRDDPMFVLIGRYGDQIERYLEVFDREQILLLKFNDLRENPASVVNTCLKFLECTPFQVDTERNPESQHAASSYNAIGRMFRRLPPGFASALKKGLPAPMMRQMRSSIQAPAQQIEIGDRSEVMKLFSDDLEKLRRLTGIVFS